MALKVIKLYLHKMWYVIGSQGSFRRKGHEFYHESIFKAYLKIVAMQYQFNVYLK